MMGAVKLIFLYFTAALSLTMVQGLNVGVAPKVVPGDSGMCPSTGNARQLLTSHLGSLTAHFSSIGQCGEGLW